MSIRVEVVVELATVTVNDDYRVELEQLRRVTDYSPLQALELARELAAAASHAADLLEQAGEHLAETAGNDQPRDIRGDEIL
ncbi:hypothetical protein [Agromyces larvae]|uniref:Uncharacterized protein n=1 Tax=Agromyces larvae TaxID=2929802 RepID=A0ABY4C5X9_9MICO|nr:hypothetical protein [Agromyces larvae]UOE45491.1 hypothetical protein MTO99_06960 [Agromyces larvae]